MKNFEFKIDWSKGLMSKLAYGLKHGLWFQRNGEKFFVPAEQISAYFDSNFGFVEIYFWSESPNTMATYSIMSYRKRWAIKKEDLKDIYEEKE